MNDNSEDYLVCEECVDGMMPDGNDCTVADEQCVEALPNCFKCQVNQLTGLDECAICDEGYILVSNNLQLYEYGSF